MYQRYSKLKVSQVHNKKCCYIFLNNLGEVNLIGSTIIITRGVMTFDCYGFSYFGNLFKQRFQVDDWIHQVSLKIDFVLGNFDAWWCLRKGVKFIWLSLQSEGSNITIPYTEIGADFQQKPFGSIVVGGVIFLVFKFGCIWNIVTGIGNWSCNFQFWIVKWSGRNLTCKVFPSQVVLPLHLLQLVTQTLKLCKPLITNEKEFHFRILCHNKYWITHERWSGFHI